jgi:predicted O-linked N-acetylglucosamine transferase (SPINDLY family)
MRYADQWHDISRLADEQLAEKIYSDNIDILVDLAGHTNGNRLVVFAHKPSPVQVTYLGYPDTTGMSRMDARITDQWADPEGEADRNCSERLVRLPCGFLCFQPPDESPGVSAAPSLAEGRITFGSFNNLAKITPEVISAWADILRQTPAGRLIVKSRGLDDSGAGERLKAMFMECGAAADQIVLSGHIQGYRDHMEYYANIDIALDTFPYNGTTTTCEALWMGVPVVTLSGHNHAGRVGVSLLSRLGLHGYIAGSVRDYVGLAAGQAGKLHELAALRRTLRAKMADSPLTRSKEFCHYLETAYSSLMSSEQSSN